MILALGRLLRIPLPINFSSFFFFSGAPSGLGLSLFFFLLSLSNCPVVSHLPLLLVFPQSAFVDSLEGDSPFPKKQVFTHKFPLLLFIFPLPAFSFNPLSCIELDFLRTPHALLLLLFSPSSSSHLHLHLISPHPVISSHLECAKTAAARFSPWSVTDFFFCFCFFFVLKKKVKYNICTPHPKTNVQNLYFINKTETVTLRKVLVQSLSFLISNT